MKTKNLLRQIADLILASEEDTSGWIEVPALRRIWYVLSGLLGFLVFYFLLSVPLERFAVKSESVTLFYRILGLCINMLLSSVILLLTWEYFRYVLSQNVRIRLLNVFVFYVYSVLFFGMIYYQLWLLWPTLFNYVDPTIRHSPLPIRDPWGLAHLRLEFIVFSALQTVNGSFYKIHSSGIIPSLIGWVQAVYTVCLIALLIASYVNQNVGRRKR